MMENIVTPETGTIVHTLSMTHKLGVILVGNINGGIADFADDIVRMHNNTLFLCTGNFMVGRMNPREQELELGYLEGICSKHDNIVATIRGELDNPCYFNREKLEKINKGLSDYLKHVIFLDDYSIVNTRIGAFLCIGGKAIGGSNLSDNGEVDPWTKWTDLPNGLFNWKGGALTVFDPTPTYVEEITEDGPTMVDKNPINEAIKHHNVTRILTNVTPSAVDDEKYKLAENLALTFMWRELHRQGIDISFWYSATDIPAQTIRKYNTTFVRLLVKETEKWPL